MYNNFMELGETTFSAPNLLVHFKESLHRISRESLLSEKLFSRAPVGFNGESAMGALPINRAKWHEKITRKTLSSGV
jgi:hypothetical protein